MPTVNSNTVNLTLTSTWKCTWADDDHNSTYVSQASTTDTQSASFSAEVPPGATITDRTLKTTWSNTGTVQTAQVDGAALGASVDSRAVSSMVHNYTWRASAAAMYNQGTYSRYMYVSAYIAVTYTEPKSGLSLNKTTMDAGESVTATIMPQSTAYTHELTYTFGSEVSTKTLAANVKTWSFTVPMEWLAQVPNATSRVMTVKLETFSGATNLGNVTKDVTIVVPASVVPTITGFTATLVSNGVDASITRYVQNYSKCLLEITGAAGGSYSPITGYSITGGGISSSAASGTFGPFNLPGDVVFTAKVTDARGRTATRQVAIEIMPYTAPTFSSPEAWRSNYDGVKNQKGTYVRLKSGASFSSLGEQNAVTLKGRVYIKGGEAPAWETMTPDTELILGGGTLLSTRTYIAQIQVSDLLESRITEFIIPTKMSGLSIMAGVSGAAIGKSAETPGILDVAWPIVAPGLAPNPNLLHNADFRNPVNQRGVSGAISTGSYFFDRWIRNSGTVTVNAGYLTLASGAVVEQRIEGNLLAGVICTVSFEVGSTIYHGSGVFPTNNGTVSVEVDGYPNITFGCATGYMFVLIPATSNTSIKRLKCEMGFVGTLHLDPPMDYGTELAKCQRYFQHFGDYPVIYGYAYVSYAGVAVFPTLVRPRVAPTMVTTSCMVRQNGYDIPSTLVGVASFGANGHLRYDINAVSGGYQAPGAFAANMSSTNFSWSADL